MESFVTQPANLLSYYKTGQKGLDEKSLKFILGLKLHQYRKDKHYSLKQLSARSGLSVSYLNEIEKGKKYPKPDKILSIAEALDVTFDDLISLQLGERLNPLSNVLQTSFFKDIPLEMFGVNISGLIEMMSEAPDRFSALFDTFKKIASRYNMGVEHFLLTALRSYVEMHGNYFEEIEEAAVGFRRELGHSGSYRYTCRDLERILVSRYKYNIDYQTLGQEPDLKLVRSLFVTTRSKKRKLLINENLNEEQRLFILGRELGYQILSLSERVDTSIPLQFQSFGQILNNFQASYFSGALLVYRDHLIRKLEYWFAQPTWDANSFSKLLAAYPATAELFFHRLSQLIPKFFELNDMFFLRVTHFRRENEFAITKELNFSRLRNAHAMGLDEHHCRRWASIRLLNQLNDLVNRGKWRRPVISVQHSEFIDKGDEYFALCLAQPNTLVANENQCIVLSFKIDERFKGNVQFWADPSIPKVKVGTTCERCELDNCRDRIAEPIVYRNEVRQKSRDQKLEALALTIKDSR